MNKTIGQLFREYFAQTVLGKSVFGMRGHDPFGTALGVKIVVASERRTNKENHDGLIAEAVANMVGEDIKHFQLYARSQGFRAFSDEHVIAGVAKELAVVTADLQKSVLNRLEYRRENLFEESEYTTEFAHAYSIEHPMVTFTRQNNALDAYFAEKKVAKSDFPLAELRVKLIALLRAGNAVFQRHEWEPRIIQKETANE